MMEKKKRIEIIDAARGLAVTLMVAHHALYNAAAFLDAPWWVFNNPIFNVLQAIFTGLFIFVSGISSRFSRGNIERGSIVLVLAVIITYVTYRIEVPVTINKVTHYMNMPIVFGILHLLGTFMIFYGITQKLWDKIPRKTAILTYIALFFISVLARTYLSPSSENLILRDVLSVLGWRQEGFVNNDYQTILPWIFVFLSGTWAGQYIRENKLPTRFYEMNVPFFPLVGRNALLIYALHQPALYGITLVILSF
jgi:uncharacterized membrane protein